jgi:hypothetical protein
LEECLTLNELLEAHNALTERESRTMEFHANLAGRELQTEGDTNTKQQADDDSLAARLRKRKQEQLESQGKTDDAKQEFSHGVGYKVIGG